MRKVLVFGAILGSYFGGAYGQLPPAPPSRLAVYASAPVYPAPKAVEFTPGWVVELRGEQIVAIAATAERVAVLTARGELAAFSAADGAASWRVHDLADESELRVEGGLFGVGGHPVRWFDPADGSETSEPPASGKAERTPRLTEDGRVELMRVGRERPEWTVHAGTAFGTPPLLLRTDPAARRPRPVELVVAGTMDGLLQAFRAGSGQLAWSRRTAGRLARPIGVWHDAAGTGPDRTRLLVAAVGSRKIEAFRAVDGSPAGMQELQPEEALVLAGPAVVPGREACVVAWSPWPAAGSRILLLGLASVP